MLNSRLTPLPRLSAFALQAFAPQLRQTHPSRLLFKAKKSLAHMARRPPFRAAAFPISPTPTCFRRVRFMLARFMKATPFREGKPDHLFTQEVEVGLPYRFGIAAETTFESFNGGRGFSTASIEARYALADWNKIPLNPTLFVEYKFGVGPIRHDEGPPPPPGQVDPDAGTAQIPNAYEMRLLLAQDFGDQIEWAMNFFFEKENTGDRGREWGVAQSATKPVILPNERLKVGVEMQYQNFTVKDTRGDPLHRFIIGPTIAWKPSANTRFDVSPLFGCTDDSPHVQVFAVFSWLLGGSEGQEAEAPTSTRNR